MCVPCIAMNASHLQGSTTRPCRGAIAIGRGSARSGIIASGEEASMATTTSRVSMLAAAVLLCWAIPAWGQSSVEDKGKPLVDAKCNSCHPLTARTGSGYTPDGWKTVMRMMTNHGVGIAPEELGPMTDYLVKTFPV